MEEKGPRSGKGLGMAACGFGSTMSSGWNAATGRSDVAVASGWTLRTADVSEKPFESLYTCHHLSSGQILTTTHE